MNFVKKFVRMIFKKRNFYNPFKQCAMDLHFTEILIQNLFVDGPK